MRMFDGYGDFFFLLGSAAAGLIGLLFVVATLMSGRERASAAQGARLYTTPTVFHLSLVLVVSAVSLVPARDGLWACCIFDLSIAAGLAYSLMTLLRLWKRSELPHWSDFWCYGAAPPAIYLGLLTAAAAIRLLPSFAPPLTAFALLGLLIVCIRNAWIW